MGSDGSPGRLRAGQRGSHGLAAVLLALVFLLVPTPVLAADSALLIDIQGPIGPAVESYVVRGLEEAGARGASAVILRIDTPGGLDQSTRGIIKAILASNRPVIGFVAPSGARAASAGAYILMACHVAAMAPGTTVGSATPVQLGGGMPQQQPPSPQPPQQGAEPSEGDAPGDGESDAAGDGGTVGARGTPPTLQDKIVNDARAYMRGLADLRGRPADEAERFVSEATNLTAAEALARGLVDMTAGSVREVLVKSSGLEVDVAGTKTALKTDLMDVETFAPTWRDRFLGLITNPNIAYLLLMVGLYGLVLEATNPGILVAGITGATCLIVGLYALHLLPLNYAGLALMALGVALMVTEAFVPAFGALGIGGAVCFALGSIFLIDTDMPGFEISPILIGTVSLATAAIFVLVLTFAARAWRQPVVSGVHEMIGAPARVIAWSGDTGEVSARGEVWAATGETGLTPGTALEIRAVRGLTLVVATAGAHPALKTEEGTHA